MRWEAALCEGNGGGGWVVGRVVSDRSSGELPSRGLVYIVR